MNNKSTDPPQMGLVPPAGGTLGTPKILTPEEVALVIRKPLRRVYELVKEGKLVAIKDGRRLTFLLGDVEAYVNRFRTGQTTPTLPAARHLAKPRLRVNPGLRRTGGVP